MKRTVTLVLAVGLLVCSAACKQSREKIILKAAQNSSTEHPYQTGLERFKAVLEAETEGVVEVQIFPNGQLGSEEEVLQGLMKGAVDVTVVSAGNLAALVPEIELFNLPFIFRDDNHFYMVLDGPVGQKVGGIIETKTRSLLLGYWSFGIRHAWNSVRPIQSPEDFAELRIRVASSPVVLDTFNAFGAQARHLPWGDLYSALEKGELDGAECGVVDLLVERFYEVTKYVTKTGHLMGAAPVLFNKERFDGLSPEFRTAVLKAGDAAVIAARDAQDAFVAEALAKLEANGIEFYDVDKAAFKEVVQPIYEKYAAQVGGMDLIEQVGGQ